MKAGKLKMGANESITTWYSDIVVVHINHAPLCISLFADEDEANVGAMLGIAKDLRTITEPLRKSVHALQAGDEPT